jgi:hypothetical protein
MADYVNNCKQQERTADNAHHILMRGCTLQHCWRLASSHSARDHQIRYTVRADGRKLWCQWQVTRAGSGQCCGNAALVKLTEKMHCLLIWVTLCHTTHFCLNQAQGVAPMTYRIGGCGLFWRCHASNNASASVCNVSLFSLCFFSVLLKITLCR